VDGVDTGSAEHADVAVASGLGGDPVDQVEQILAFLVIEECPRSAGAAGAGAGSDRSRNSRPVVWMPIQVTLSRCNAEGLNGHVVLLACR
jgi:hypothetical protein